MTFSETFRKAINAITPDYEPDYERCLDNPPVDNYFRSQADFEETLRQHCQVRHEPLRIGQPVAVYADTAQGMFICYGVISDFEWNVWVGDYQYSVQPCQKKACIATWAFLVRPARPDEMRLLMRPIEGGFPELATKQ